MGGFECSTHQRRDGQRLDLIAATRHDEYCAADYAQLATLGIRTVRDGLRWHKIEAVPGRYDWSSFLPMLRAARDTGTQVIWSLAHWGWPQHLDIWSPAFVDRFAQFSRAAARIVREESDAIPLYLPVNEISFWSWAGGSVGYIAPFGIGRGSELKTILVRASIASIEAVRSVDARSRIVAAEPAIHIAAKSDSPEAGEAARAHTNAQFEALDALSGRRQPELGGRPDYLDLIGVNYYLHNQWIDEGLPLSLADARSRPLSAILADVHDRYRKPILVSETGIEGRSRPSWLRVIGAEVAKARNNGVPVIGLCWFPIVDYPGWDDNRYCPAGLLGYRDETGTRPVFEPLATELETQVTPAQSRARRQARG